MADVLARRLTDEQRALGIELLGMMIRIRVLEEGIDRHFLPGDIVGIAASAIADAARKLARKAI